MKISFEHNWTNEYKYENANMIIDVPFKDALFRDKSRQSRNTINTVGTRQGEIKPCFLFREKHRNMSSGKMRDRQAPLRQTTAQERIARLGLAYVPNVYFIKQRSIVGYLSTAPPLQVPTLGNRPDEPKAMTRIGCWLLCAVSSAVRASALIG